MPAQPLMAFREAVKAALRALNRTPVALNAEAAAIEEGFWAESTADAVAATIVGMREKEGITG